MEEQVFESNKLINIFLVLTVILSGICLAAMLYYASVKVVIVSAEEAEVQAENAVVSETFTGKNLRLDIRTTSDSGYFVIPCPNVAEDKIFISERPDLKEVRITFKEVNSDYFSSYAPNGDFSKVSSINETISEDEVIVTIETKAACYGKFELRNRELMVQFEEIDKSETVVCVDPAYGGAYTGTVVGDLNEKDINLSLARMVKAISAEKNYRVVLTRDSDENINIEERLEILETVGADYYVGIALNTNVDDRTVYGMSALYNGSLFRDGFENVDFADAILVEAAKAGKTRANSLEKADKNNVILMALDIPGTTLMAGTITNEAESMLLSKDEYLKMIAEGIISALDSVVNQ